MKAAVARTMRRLIKLAAREVYRSAGWQDQMLLAGVSAAHGLRRLDRLQTLGDAEFQVFSQWGEDGIIEWLVSRLPGIPESFVEFGVEDYREANTRFLLRHRHWRGLVLDGAPAKIASLRDDPVYWRHDLNAQSAFITRDNIDGLIAQNGFGGELGLLSIDIDGNDYWVWQAIGACRPWIVIAEYNAMFGDIQPLTIPYQADFQRMAGHPSGLYYGASAPALQQLGTQCGYSLVGSNRAGNDLFFVRNDVLERLQGEIVDRTPRPSLFRDARAADGTLLHVGGIDRLALIQDLPVRDLASGQDRPLRECGRLFSDRWLELMGAAAPRP